MRKIVLTVLALCGLNGVAQVKIGDNATTVNANSLLELESTNKGLLYPRVALIATTLAAPLLDHEAGMTVYNTATIGDVTPGVYINDGTKWAAFSGSSTTTAAAAAVTAVCNGFTGTYFSGTATRAFTVSYTNNTFASVTIPLAVSDLVLSPASGLTVASVASSATIASGATSVVTYTLGGSLTASTGTVITGTFTKLGLKCSSTVTVGNAPPVVSAGNAQAFTINVPVTATLTGTATDADGIASYSWARTGGTGTATPVITSPSSASTTVTGINAVGTYIFTLTATDNIGIAASATVTLTASLIPTTTVNGANGTTLTFMSHNLGADYTADPLTGSQAILGNYYQYGRQAPVATAYTSAAAISGWNTATNIGQPWLGGTETAPVKTAADPCPAGFRVPYYEELRQISSDLNGNIGSRTGSWTESTTNYTTGVRISNNGVVKLYFPAAGIRWTGGALSGRGSTGQYWHSAGHQFVVAITQTGGKPFQFGSSGTSDVQWGRSVRCILE